MSNSRVAFVADCHIANHKSHGGSLNAGINRRCQFTFDTLARAVARANKEDCVAFVVLGDLFDHDHPTPQILAATRDVLREFRGDWGVYVLAGNHDTSSDAIGDHALGPLASDVLDGFTCRIATGSTIGRFGDSGVLVPYACGGDVLGRIREGMERCTTPKTILGIHAGIRDENTPSYLRDAANSVYTDALFALMQERGIRQCFAGDWHVHSSWRRNSMDVVQVGALCPTGWDNPELEGYGSLIIADGETWERVEIPGPRFLVNPKWPDDFNESAPYTFVRLIGATTDAVRVQWVERVVAGRIAAYEALPDADAIDAQVQSAARAARSADTLAEALARFVEAMPLPDGVDRSAVLLRARQYLEERP